LDRFFRINTFRAQGFGGAGYDDVRVVTANTPSGAMTLSSSLRLTFLAWMQPATRDRRVRLGLKGAVRLQFRTGHSNFTSIRFDAGHAA